MNRLFLVKFKNLFQNFDFNLIEKFLLHKAYNYKIEFKKNFRIIKSWIYSIFYHKLIKLKKYFNENFKKSFITVNLVVFVFFVLFVTKFNDNFRFYVNYKKFNVIIKRNKYFISLIKYQTSIKQQIILTKYEYLIVEKRKKINECWKSLYNAISLKPLNFTKRLKSSTIRFKSKLIEKQR